MLVLIFIVLGVNGALAAPGGINQACGIINSLPCDQATQSPVCGSNGVVYTSECEFAKAQCQNSSIQADQLCSFLTTTSAPMSNTTTAGNFTTSNTSTKLTVPQGNFTSTLPWTPSTTTDTFPGTIPNMTTQIPMINMTTVDFSYTMGNGSTSTPTHVSTINVTMATVATTISTPDNVSVVCKIILATQCPPGDSPVCATGIVEYPSLCHFTHAQCYDPNLSILQGGACPITTTTTTTTTKAPSVEDIICQTILSQPCNDDGVVLCGSDGTTYSNSCEYEKERCVHDDLYVVKPGIC